MADNTTYQNELKSITKNAGITAVGLVVMNVMSFVNNAIITRTVGADEYGLYVLATRILEFLIMIAALGLNQSSIRFISMYAGQNEPQRVKGTIYYTGKVTVGASLIFALATLLLGSYISNEFFERPELAYYLKILMIALPFGVFMNWALHSFIGLKQVKYQVLLANIATPLLFFGLISGTFLLGYRLEGLIRVYIINLVVIALAGWIIIRKTYFKKVARIVPEIDKRKLWDYNIPVYVAHFANTAFRFSPIFIMGYFLDNEEIGIFNVSYKVGGLVMLSMTAFGMIFMPTISGLFAQRDKATISGIFKTVTKWIFTFSLVIVALVTAYHETILSIFGEVFTTGSTVLMVIMAGELINASTGLSGTTILMSGRSKVVLVNALAQLAVIVALAWWLTPVYGSVGTAIAYAVSLLLLNVARVIELYRFEKIHPYKLSLVKPLIAAVISFLPVYFLNGLIEMNAYIEMVAGAILFGLIFILVTLLLRLDRDDRYILEVILAQLKKK